MYFRLRLLKVLSTPPITVVRGTNRVSTPPLIGHRGPQGQEMAERDSHLSVSAGRHAPTGALLDAVQKAIGERVEAPFVGRTPGAIQRRMQWHNAPGLEAAHQAKHDWGRENSAGCVEDE